MGVGDVVQGLGLFGIIKCVIGGSIFAIIGMILLIWGLTKKSAVHASISKIGAKCIEKQMEDKNKDGVVTGTHTEYKCNTAGDWEVKTDGKTYKVTGSWTSRKEYKVGDTLPVILHRDRGTAEWSPEVKGVMIGFGTVFLVVGIGMGAFCFWCRTQAWCRTAMGIQEGVGMARSFMPGQKQGSSSSGFSPW